MIIFTILKIKNVLSINKFLFLSIFLILLLLILAIYLWQTRDDVTFELDGLKEVTLPLNEQYKEPGFIAKVKDKNYAKKVIISGKVDSSKIGEQTIVYKLIYNNKEYKLKRTINVVDDKKPIISFDSNDENICINHTNDSYHVSATDNYDGDITDKVQIEERKENNELDVVFRVKDSSGNTAVAEKKYYLRDVERPKINLVNEDIYIELGNKYYEPGYTATDNCDGNITDNVKIEGHVDENKAGTYTLTYKVTDEANNTSTITRNVHIIDVSEMKNKIYLTFDDGPSNITPQILDILKEEGVSATFFIIGFGHDKDDIVKRIVDEGHTIAIHGTSHVYKEIYSSEDAYMNNINSLQDQIYNLTGVKTWITRFPGGSSNLISKFNPGIMTRLTKLVTEKGYHYFDWNIDSDDAGRAYISSMIYNNVVTNLSHNRLNVVLMHDASSKQQTLLALKDIIEYGKNNGYVFDKITMDTPVVVHSVNN